MSRFELNCNYCGHTWQIDFMPEDYINCAKCKDGNIRVTNSENNKIDAYAGSPPFVEQEEEDPDKWYI